MSGGSRMGHLGMVNMLGTTKSIFESLTQLLHGNPQTGSTLSQVGPRMTQEPLPEIMQ
jgi:hypothetical protein